MTKATGSFGALRLRMTNSAISDGLGPFANAFALATAGSHLFLQDIHDGADFGGGLEDRVCELACNVCELLFVIADLEFRELESVSRADDDNVFVLRNLACGTELFESAEGHTRMRAAVKTDAVAAVGCVGEFFFRDAHDHAVCLLDGAYSLRIADRVADLDGAGESLLCLYRNELVEAAFVCLEERVCVFGLGYDNARDAVDEAHSLAVFETLGESAHVTEVAARDNHGVRDRPAEFLADFRRNCFLAFDAEAVHGVGEVNAVVLRDFLYNLHAAVKVSVEGEHDAAVRNRLDELCGAGLAGREEHDGRDAGLGAVGAEGCGGVAGGGASDGVNRVNLLFDDVVHLAYENCHAEVFERARVGVATEFDLEASDAEIFCQRGCVKERAPAFAHGDDVFDRHVREHHFALAPDAAHVFGLKAHAAFGKELLPFFRATTGECCAVVFDFQEASIDLAAINDVGQRVGVVAVDISEMSVKLRHNNPFDFYEANIAI